MANYKVSGQFKTSATSDIWHTVVLEHVYGVPDNLKGQELIDRIAAALGDAGALRIFRNIRILERS